MYPDLPIHLAQEEAQGLCLDQPIAQFEIGDQKNFIYLVLDWSTKKAAIVDPQKDLSKPLQALSENGFELTEILLTHSHWDHTAGVEPLLKMLPKLTLRVGELDLHRIPEIVALSPTLKILSDGENFKIGSIGVRAFHTPGHSAGEFSYFLDRAPGMHRPYLFTGDSIFIRDCGRTDFQDGSNEQMFSSIQKIKKLPLETVFLVGHHYAVECATTLRDEMEKSPPFRCQSVKELAALP
ncbi:MAG: MBL fold metallo-hydrolase [Bdellovibrionales bacterium]|nr:MBL fold metallo-hydrolase [Oligoflexia bacterium]